MAHALDVLQLGRERVPESSLIRRLEANLLTFRSLPEALLRYQEDLGRFPEDHDLRLDYAELLSRTGKVPESLEQIKQVLVREPEQPNALLLQGVLQQRQGRWDAARDSLVEAARLDPENPEAWSQLARVWEHLSEWGRARESLRRATELDPESVEFLRRYVEMQERLFDPEDPQALQELRHTLAHLKRLDPESVWPKAHDAELRARLGETAIAEQKFQEVLEQEPEYAWAWFRLGALLLRLERPEEARQALERGVKLEPETPWALQQLAQAEEQLGQTDAAISRYEHLLEHSPSLPVLQRLVELYWAELRFQDVRRTLEDGIRRFPKAPRLSLELAQLHDLRGRYSEARQVFSSLPNSGMRADFHQQLGRLARLSGDAVQAEADFRRALELDPESHFSRMQLVEILLQDGRAAEAREDLLVLRSWESTASWATIQLVQWERQHGTPEHFQTLLAAGLEQFPESRELQLLELEQLVQAQAWGEAEQVLLGLQMRFPADEAVLNHLALVYRETGRLPEAREVLLESLNQSGDNLWPLLQLGLLLPESERRQWLGSEAERLEAALRALTLSTSLWQAPEDLAPEEQAVLQALHRQLRDEPRFSLTPALSQRERRHSHAPEISGEASAFLQGALAVLWEEESPEEAIRRYEVLLSRSDLPGSLRPWWRARLGVVSEQARNPKKAAQAYASLLREQPGATWALMRQAIALTHDGREAETIPIYQSLLQERPNHPMSLNNLAWAYLTLPDPKLRNPEEALELARQAVELEGSIDHWDTLAEAWFQNGNSAEAIRVLREAVRKQPFPESREAYLHQQYLRFQAGDRNVPPPPVS